MLYEPGCPNIGQAVNPYKQLNQGQLKYIVKIEFGA